MEALVIQSGVRHGRFAELTRSEGECLTVGRSFNNDLVVTDPHVAPQQLEFRQQDGCWMLCVLDEMNPVSVNGQKVTGHIAVKSGDQVSIGRTKLSVFAEDHPIAPTKKLILSNWLSGQAINPLWPIAILLLSCLISFALEYVEGSTTLEWKEGAYEGLLAAVMIVLWAGIWAIAGRVFRHQHHLGLQIIATALILLLAGMVTIVADFIVYPFHSVMFEESVAWVLFFAIASSLLYCNLVVAANIQRPAWVSSIAVGLLLAVIYGFNVFSESEDFVAQPVYSTTLTPPVLGVYMGESSDEYWADMSRIVDGG